MIPGEYKLEEGEIGLNVGRETVTVVVTNQGDRPVQIGSHFHFLKSIPCSSWNAGRPTASA